MQYFFKKKPREHLTRIEKALYVRKNSVNDFFGGWSPDDFELLNKYKFKDKVELIPGVIIDWLGVKCYKSNHAWLGNHEEGVYISDLPIPDDTIHAEAIEYIAMLTALDERKVYSDFTVVELGASYSPWAVAASVVARRSGVKKITAIAVEANKNSIEKIAKNIALNELENVVNFDLKHCAVHTDSGIMYFPKVDTSYDNGGQAVSIATDYDYRGLKMEFEQVQSFGLADILENIEYVDFLHIDLQGVEELLIQDSKFLSVLNIKVKNLFLATQSRMIEGLALMHLSRMGWHLVTERPTVYKQNPNTSDINGWTLRDGAQFWKNKNI